MVPAPEKYRLTASVRTSISATSWSGIEYVTHRAHAGSEATTMRATCGGGGSAALVGGGCGGASQSGTSVVRLPDRANATYSLPVVTLRAIARGFRPSNEMVLRCRWDVASNTRTSFDRATLTNARFPAKTTSA